MDEAIGIEGDRARFGLERVEARLDGLRVERQEERGVCAHLDIDGVIIGVLYFDELMELTPHVRSFKRPISERIRSGSSRGSFPEAPVSI